MRELIWSASCSALLSTTTFATTLDCAQVDQYTSNIGVTCQTSKGIQFERIQDGKAGDMGWEDLKAGRIWFDSISDNLNWVAADNFCSNQLRSLPSDNDFEIATIHGFLEILRDMRSRTLWSETTFEPVPHEILAIYFDGQQADTDEDNPYSIHSAQCIE